MFQIAWDPDKNSWLKNTRGITFEEIVFFIEHGGLVEIIEHPNRDRFGHQMVLVMNILNYIYLVPFVIAKNGVFLKSIIPSRKMTKKYLERRAEK